MLTLFNPRPEFDSYRVDAIRGLLEENKYIVDPQQIAAKFIELESALRGQ